MNEFLNYVQHMDWEKLVSFLVQGVAVLFCLSVHEMCHALTAYVLGDPTAKNRHRISFNPLRHLDLFGALMMLFFGFGWAKAVPVDTRSFKNPKRGLALTALAGPVSNFILAYLALVVANVLLPLVYAGVVWAEAVFSFFWTLSTLSLGLGIFNLIPFPPLDGSKVVEGFLPDKIAAAILRYERYGMVVLMALLWFGWLNGPLTAMRDAAFSFFQAGAAWGQYLGMQFI